MRSLRLPLLCAAFVCVAVLLIPAPNASAMSSRQISQNLCETTGGGRFVPVPDWVSHDTGERIDVRLLEDLREIDRRFDIFIYEGLDTSDAHSAQGEHPLGLALDIGPTGRSWRSVSALAKWAEPRQNQPRAPFRWVGYNGDSGHGKGDHLHLSWNHGVSKFGKPVRTVYTRNCPRPELPRAEALIREEGMVPLSFTCRGGGAKFVCPYRAAAFERRESGPVQTTRICEGKVIQRKPWTKRSRVRVGRCENSRAATRMAEQLADHLSESLTRVRSVKCWPAKGKWRCVWSGAYADGFGNLNSVRGSASRARPAKPSDEWNVQVR